MVAGADGFAVGAVDDYRRGIGEVAFAGRAALEQGLDVVDREGRLVLPFFDEGAEFGLEFAGVCRLAFEDDVKAAGGHLELGIMLAELDEDAVAGAVYFDGIDVLEMDGLFHQSSMRVFFLTFSYVAFMTP